MEDVQFQDKRASRAQPVSRLPQTCPQRQRVGTRHRSRKGGSLSWHMETESRFPDTRVYRPGIYCRNSGPEKEFHSKPVLNAGFSSFLQADQRRRAGGRSSSGAGRRLQAALTLRLLPVRDSRPPGLSRPWPNQARVSICASETPSSSSKFPNWTGQTLMEGNSTCVHSEGKGLTQNLF